MASNGIMELSDIARRRLPRQLRRVVRAYKRGDFKLALDQMNSFDGDWNPKTHKRGWTYENWSQIDLARELLLRLVTVDVEAILNGRESEGRHWSYEAAAEFETAVRGQLVQGVSLHRGRAFDEIDRRAFLHALQAVDTEERGRLLDDELEIAIENYPHPILPDTLIKAVAYLQELRTSHLISELTLPKLEAQVWRKLDMSAPGASRPDVVKVLEDVLSQLGGERSTERLADQLGAEKLGYLWAAANKWPVVRFLELFEPENFDKYSPKIKERLALLRPIAVQSAIQALRGSQLLDGIEQILPLLVVAIQSDPKAEQAEALSIELCQAVAQYVLSGGPRKVGEPVQTRYGQLNVEQLKALARALEAFPDNWFERPKTDGAKPTVDQLHAVFPVLKELSGYFEQLMMQGSSDGSERVPYWIRAAELRMVVASKLSQEEDAQAIHDQCSVVIANFRALARGKTTGYLTFGEALVLRASVSERLEIGGKYIAADLVEAIEAYGAVNFGDMARPALRPQMAALVMLGRVAPERIADLKWYWGGATSFDFPTPVVQGRSVADEFATTPN